MTEGANPPTGGGSLRIGSAERTAAMKALDEHLSAGRLEVEEYGDRSAAAAKAITAADLAALFTDLPPPHPALPGVHPALPVVTSEAPVAPRRPGAFETWGPRLAAVTPIIAFALFALSGFRIWWVFLLIPIVGALAYSGWRSEDRDRTDRRRDR